MYRFYLDGIQLPLTPDKLTMKVKGKNKTLTLVNDGEINFLKLPGLTEISFQATFPMLTPYSFTNYPDGFKSADFYLGKLESLMTSLRPFRFIVSRMSPEGKLLYDTNLRVSLEDYSPTESAKDGFDVSVSISLKQYIDFATKTIEVAPVTHRVVAAKTQRPAKVAAKTYTVKRGDCLWAIAQAQMGDGSKYPSLYAANQATIDAKNKGAGLPKYTIYAGQVFTIP